MISNKNIGMLTGGLIGAATILNPQVSDIQTAFATEPASNIKTEIVEPPCHEEKNTLEKSPDKDSIEFKSVTDKIADTMIYAVPIASLVGGTVSAVKTKKSGGTNQEALSNGVKSGIKTGLIAVPLSAVSALSPELATATLIGGGAFLTGKNARQAYKSELANGATSSEAMKEAAVAGLKTSAVIAPFVLLPAAIPAAHCAVLGISSSIGASNALNNATDNNQSISTQESPSLESDDTATKKHSCH